MLLDGVNYEDELERVANFLEGLAMLDRAYIAIPTRQPAEMKEAEYKLEKLGFFVRRILYDFFFSRMNIKCYCPEYLYKGCLLTSGFIPMLFAW